MADQPVHCKKCHRLLRTPESRAAQIGPVCAGTPSPRRTEGIHPTLFDLPKETSMIEPKVGIGGHIILADVLNVGGGGLVAGCLTMPPAAWCTFLRRAKDGEFDDVAFPKHERPSRDYSGDDEPTDDLTLFVAAIAKPAARHGKDDDAELE